MQLMKFVRPSHIRGYEEDRVWLQSIGTAGFSLASNHMHGGPQFYDCTFPERWQEEYTDNAYLWRDPVLLRSLLNGQNYRRKDEDYRWSDIKLPDVFGIMESAKEHGLIYGTVCIRTVQKRRYLLSVSRPDREINNEELLRLSIWFSEFVEKLVFHLHLTEKELGALRCLAADMSLNDAAKTLGISVPAIKSRLKSARNRVGCQTNYHLIAQAMRSKLLD